MADDGVVQCPLHGAHAVTSHGKCWYCAQSGSASGTPVSGDEPAVEDEKKDSTGD